MGADLTQLSASAAAVRKLELPSVQDRIHLVRGYLAGLDAREEGVQGWSLRAARLEQAFQTLEQSLNALGVQDHSARDSILIDQTGGGGDEPGRVQGPTAAPRSNPTPGRAPGALDPTAAPFYPRVTRRAHTPTAPDPPDPTPPTPASPSGSNRH